MNGIRKSSAKTLAWYVVLLISIAFFTGASIAQETDEAEGMTRQEETEVFVLDEIVVTATKRETPLSETPIAITAVSDDQIDDMGAVDLVSLYTAIPGLQYKTNSGAGWNRLTLRGLTPTTDSFELAPTVSVYLDETPVTSGQGQIRQLSGSVFDLDRVEVMKGPQGTLWGESAMGGAIRYITKKPDLVDFSAGFRIAYEFTDESDEPSYRYNATLNIPVLSDTLAARLSLYKREDGGFLDYPPAGKEDVNNKWDDGGRLALRWVPTDKFEADVSVHYVRNQTRGPYLGDLPEDPGDHKFNSTFGPGNLRSFGDDESTTTNLTVKYRFSFADLISSTSYVDREIFYTDETRWRFWSGVDSGARWVSSTLLHPDATIIDGVADYLIVLGFIPGLSMDPTIPWGGATETPADFGNRDLSVAGGGAWRGDTNRIIQELRLVSNTDTRFRWSFGLYYRTEESVDSGGREYNNKWSAAAATILPDTIPAALASYVGKPASVLLDDIIFSWFDFMVTRDVNDFAIYGEASYDLLDELELLVGLRYSNHDMDRLVEGPFTNYPGNATQFTSSTMTADDTFYAPKATLTWRPKDRMMLYGTIATGFRPGGVNPGLVGIINRLRSEAEIRSAASGAADFLSAKLSYDGDQVLSYEIGGKFSVLENRLSLAASAYYITWSDLISRNEIDIPYDPPDPREPENIGFNDSIGEAFSTGFELEVTAFITQNLMLSFAGDINNAELEKDISGPYGVGAQAGNKLGNAPEHSYYASLSYSRPLWWEGVDGDILLTFSGVAESFNRMTNELATPEYNLLNLRFTVREALENQWRIALYANNLLNEEYAYEVNEAGINWGRPRSIGAEISYLW